MMVRMKFSDCYKWIHGLSLMGRHEPRTVKGVPNNEQTRVAGAQPRD